MSGDALREAPARAHYYAQVPEALILDAGVSAAELRVYAWLDRRAGASGRWHTSRRGIGRALGLDDRTVRRAVDALEARGLLLVGAAAGQLSCFVLPARGAALTPHPDTPRCGVDAAPVRHQRRTFDDRSSIPIRKPKGKPIPARAAREPYQQLVLRTEEGALARLALVAESERRRSEQGGVGL